MQKDRSQLLLQKYIDELEKNFSTDVRKILSTLHINKEKIRFNLNLYYNSEVDLKDIKEYYQPVKRNQSKAANFRTYHDLISSTHRHRFPYYISKDHYLYTWVDLQPDGTVKSIYSGEKKDPKEMIQQDFETIRVKHEKFLELLRNPHQPNKLDENMKKIHFDFKYNTEHIVPQSWYNSREPMKGDLHHLFVCQPACNAARGNFPYEDFSFYVPESPDEKIRNRCGVATGGRFEPEDGKGPAARAMLYFILRYPKAIKRSFYKQININLLIEWHKTFAVTLYEKHRNQAIYYIQGNRNPFIDFPELIDQIDFRQR